MAWTGISAPVADGAARRCGVRVRCPVPGETAAPVHRPGRSPSGGGPGGQGGRPCRRRSRRAAASVPGRVTSRVCGRQGGPFRIGKIVRRRKPYRHAAGQSDPGIRLNINAVRSILPPRSDERFLRRTPAVPYARRPRMPGIAWATYSVDLGSSNPYARLLTYSWRGPGERSISRGGASRNCIHKPARDGK